AFPHKKDSFPRPAIILSDHAALYVFNDENYSAILARAYRIFTNAAIRNDLSNTNIHAYLSHFILDMHKRVNEYLPEDVREISMWAIVLLFVLNYVSNDNINFKQHHATLLSHISNIANDPNSSRAINQSKEVLTNINDPFAFDDDNELDDYDHNPMNTYENIKTNNKRKRSTTSHLNSSNINKSDTNNISEQQKIAYMTAENQYPITTSNSTICTNNHDISKEQQIAYGTAPVIYQPYNIPQSYICAQPTPNGQIVNQYSSDNMVTQHQLYQQQQVPSTINVPSAYVQQVMLHSNMYPQQAILHSNTNQQQELVSSYHPAVNNNALCSSSMTSHAVSSTSISATTKRGRNDTSGVSESNVQERPQYYQTTRIFNARNTANKRHRGLNDQHKESSHPYRYEQNR
ncbi:unnamed protein product, partial [Rotaria magnacalcarata]